MAVALRRGVAVPYGSTREAVLQGLRRNGIALLPLPLLIGLLEGIWLLGEWGVPGFGWLSRWTEAMPLFALGLILLSLITAYLVERVKTLSTYYGRGPQ